MTLRSTSRTPSASRTGPTGRQEAFTLIEVMIAMGLLLVIIIATGAGITSLDRCTRRLADYTAAMSVVEAKMHAIRAATYNPPSSPFTASTVYLTNTSYISLSKSGTNLLISGSIVSKIQPVTSGHLVTVTGTFNEPGFSFTTSLQSMINRYTTGEQ